MSNQSDRSTRSRRSSRRLLLKLGLACVLAFMVGGFIGSAARLGATLDTAADVLLVNGPGFAVAFITLGGAALGYSVGHAVRRRR